MESADQQQQQKASGSKNEEYNKMELTNGLI